MTNGVILALDQGTTSSRAMAIAFDGSIVASAQEEFPQIFPNPAGLSTTLKPSGARSAERRNRR